MCFVSNVFPEAMETQVVRVQLDGIAISVHPPPCCLPGGVDCLVK